MLFKRPKGAGNIFVKSIKVIIFGEVVLCGGFYLLWRQLNYSRDFRYYMHNNWPSVLRVFYHVGKSANPMYDCEARDKEFWSATKKRGIIMESNTPSEESLSERINKRDRERKNVIEKRKEEKQQLIVETEQASYFKDAFYTTCKNIRDLLDSVETAAPSSLPEIFDKANKDLLMLKNYLFESKIFLKVYDIRKAQESIQILENDAAQLEAKLVPRKKFGFKNRRVLKKTTDKPSDVTDGLKDLKIAESITANGVGKQNNKKIYNKYGDNTCMLLGKVNETLVLDAENVNKNDVLLSDLTRCTVRIYGTPNTLHMVSLVQCTVLIGPVTTSVFVDDCRDCEFAFACQQLRLHTSTNCTIYLHVTSRAIIEDCTKICVAPYNWTYEDQISHFKLAGLDPKINNWNSLDDFNWLSKEKSSPNWAILEPELRRKSWD